MYETFEDYLEEAIKGWKRAHSDIAKHRANSRAANAEWHTHALRKDGKESGMHDARVAHDSEEAAKAHAANIRKLNPGREFKYNLYHKGKLVGTI